ncbi:hypothetical protein [Streptococcus saliviloxodontae]|uniref:Magnesium-transporting ATPase (P-type) n=1 Tax=Streptococcus saliviloxodontae TaxID=1349416 RepID=A0ABS2PMF1_9STRE|nr:hypothetical protein [Streptococcus saliviloxodontae]MBM7636175.1 magnesium-transporting ATPase (P-type) [Streptococcus saliviloxodontae]
MKKYKLLFPITALILGIVFAKINNPLTQILRTISFLSFIGCILYQVSIYAYLRYQLWLKEFRQASHQEQTKQIFLAFLIGAFFLVFIIYFFK